MIDRYFLESRINYGWSIDGPTTVKTQCGEFEVTFIVKGPERSIAIVIEAAKRSGLEIEWEDAFILQSGAVDAIYHIPSRLYTERSFDALFVLYKAEPQMLSARAKTEAQRVCTQQQPEPADEYDESDTRPKPWECMYLTEDLGSFLLMYPIRGAAEPELFVVTRSKMTLGAITPKILESYLTFAQQVDPGLELPDLINSYLEHLNAPLGR